MQAQLSEGGRCPWLSPWHLFPVPGGQEQGRWAQGDVARLIPRGWHGGTELSAPRSCGSTAHFKGERAENVSPALLRGSSDQNRAGIGSKAWASPGHTWLLSPGTAALTWAPPVPSSSPGMALPVPSWGHGGAVPVSPSPQRAHRWARGSCLKLSLAPLLPLAPAPPSPQGWQLPRAQRSPSGVGGHRGARGTAELPPAPLLLPPN